MSEARNVNGATPASAGELPDLAAQGWDGRFVAVLACAVLIALSVAAHANSATNMFVGIDTRLRIQHNEDIRSLQPWWRAMSLHLIGPANNGGTLVRRPLLSLSFALNYAALGPQAWGFQAVNIAIHTLNGVLLFALLRHTLRLRRSSLTATPTALAFTIAALWVVHPLTTEAVANIAQRAESLAATFALLTLLCAIRAWRLADSPSIHAAKARRFVWSTASVVFCLAGMGTKELFIVIPILIWLYDAIFVAHGFVQALRRRPWFYLALASTWSALATMVYLTAAEASGNFDPTRMPTYLISQFPVIVYYLRLVFWPDHLFHYAPGSRFWFDWTNGAWTRVVVCAALLVPLAAATLRSLFRRQPAGYLGACFFGMLATTSLVATKDVINEHRMYIALAAVLATAVLVLDRYASKLGRVHEGWAGTSVGLVLLTGALVPLMLRTHARNEDYHSDVKIYEPAAVPQALGLVVHMLIGGRFLDDAQVVLNDMLPVVTSAPRPPEAMPFYMSKRQVYNTLGVVRVLQGARRDDAARWFKGALIEDAGYEPAVNNLGALALINNDQSEARIQLDKALRRPMPSASALHNAGLRAFFDYDFALAEDYFARSRRQRINLPDPLSTLYPLFNMGGLGGLTLEPTLGPFEIDVDSSVERRLVLVPRPHKRRFGQ